MDSGRVCVYFPHLSRPQFMPLGSPSMSPRGFPFMGLRDGDPPGAAGSAPCAAEVRGLGARRPRPWIRQRQAPARAGRLCTDRVPGQLRAEPEGQELTTEEDTQGRSEGRGDPSGVPPGHSPEQQDWPAASIRTSKLK